MKVLHALEFSLPKLAGYTIRSKYIVEHQRSTALEPVVITSPLQGKTEKELENYEEIDSVRYYRTGKSNKLNLSSPLPARLWQRYAYSKAYAEAIRWVAKKEEVAVVHAHSSYLNGVRANQAARALRTPSVYEVRGLWQETATVNADIGTKGWKYRFVDYMDRKAMLGADRVVTLSHRLKKEIESRGVPEDRVIVVPNGVDTNVFQPRPKNAEIMAQHDLNGHLVLGFIGSIRRIEGLSLFLEHLQSIVTKYPHVRVLMVGDGEEVHALRGIVQRDGMGESVIFVGRVNHDLVLDYYSVCDVLLYPRIDAKVNHTVTPLKPLEAMAMKKLVIASDVGGLKELVEEGVNGILFRVGDGEHLVRRCFDVLENPDWRKSLGEKARQWAIEQRDWGRIIKGYKDIYEAVCF